MSGDLSVDDRAHRVFVYRVEPQLIEMGGNFVAEALTAGGAAVVLGASGHLSAIEEWARLCGSDIDTAIAKCRYHRVSLEELFGNGDVGPSAGAAFERRMREVSSWIAPEVTPIHIFDATVGALWKKGEVAAALGAEEAGEAMCGSRKVSLLCAYPESVVLAAAEAREAYRRHSRTLAAPRFPRPTRRPPGEVVSSAVFPPAPAACRSARQLVKSALTDERGRRSSYAAELVVSELSANAVRHAGTTFAVEVSLHDGAVHLAVTDAAPAPEGWGSYPVATDHGLGIVAALASEWRIEPLEDGKVVWADMSRAVEG